MNPLRLGCAVGRILVLSAGPHRDNEIAPHWRRRRTILKAPIRITGFQLALAFIIAGLALPVWADAIDDARICFQRTGDVDKDIAACTRAIESGELSQENLAATHHNRGIAYGDKGDNERAVEDYSAAIEFMPDEPDAYYNRGVAHNDLGKLADAIADYSRAIELDGDDALAYFNRAVAYQKTGELDRAIADYGKVVELEPKDSQAFFKIEEIEAYQARKLEKRSSGTGFFVSLKGHILTNQHVIDGCREIRVPVSISVEEINMQRRGEFRMPGAALIFVGEDADRDLAVLRQENARPVAAAFRLPNSEIRLGETVIVAGYPLQGLLTSDLSVSRGTVSAIAGPGDDRRLLQISAPVQAGNSGGPLLDLSGNVVGVVVSKLNVLKVARLMGDMPQNVNFAISAGTARSLSIPKIRFGYLIAM